MIQKDGSNKYVAEKIVFGHEKAVKNFFGHPKDHKLIGSKSDYKK